MTNTCLTVLRRKRRCLTAALAALAACLLLPAAALAQPELRFSDDPKAERGTGLLKLRLRPNLLQEMFLFVDNDGAKDIVVRVELAAGTQALASTTVTAKANGRTQVSFGKSEPKDGKPIPLTERPWPLAVRMLDKDGKQIGAEIAVGVARPREYVQLTRKTFSAGEENTLELLVEARPGFIGPPARVDLVLSPERIPDLVPDQPQKGTYGGFVRKGEGGELLLRAENLEFQKTLTAKGGLIHVTVDGYPRAFTLFSSFTGLKTEATPREIEQAMLRVVHPPFARPGSKLPVTVEVDNRPQGAWCALGLYRQPPLPDKLLTGLETALTLFPNPRQRGEDTDRAVKMFVNAAGPAGGLLFEPKVSDWQFDIDTKGLYGERYVGLRALRGDEKNPQPVLVLNSKRIPLQGLAGGEEKQETPLIAEKVLLHEGRAEDITLDVDLAAPKAGELQKLTLGAPVPLKAESKDPTGTVKAVFFAGRPLPDGKIPPAAVQAEGVKLPANPNLWTAELAVGTDKRATIPVSVQMTNGVGQTLTKTIQIQLIDPKGAANGGAKGPKAATISGTVREGSRGVPGTKVSLTDEKGALKGAATTDSTGRYSIKNVPPGAYSVNAARSASRTRGVTAVVVPEGVDKVENIDVKLTR
ncbi:MAG: carboxypeptidase-like regulatory domain-containing protein [Gemmataceae bacterium]|nr:carboxypeptidase-like regulatory domain-containing protein [Gemmataceae bacterium]